MINIVVPMAGLGSRFTSERESLPKPLIEVEPGRPMIGYLIDFLSLEEPHRFVFICRAEHERRFGIVERLRRMAPNSAVVLVEELTRGPAVTSLRAADLIDNDDELVVAYCDSFLTIDFADVLVHARSNHAAGALITYPSADPRESYAVLGADGRVLRTAEKQVISTNATAGFYYFGTGREYVAAARRMIDGAPPAGPELFVCPVYNELIAAGETILSFPISRDARFDSGTPQGLADVRRRLAEHGRALPGQYRETRLGAPARGH